MDEILVGVDYCKFINWESSDDFSLYEMGRYACIPNYSYERVISQRSIIHFVVSGKGHLELNGVRHDVHAGQAFIIPEDIHAFYQADAKEPWEYIWLHVGGPKLPVIFKEAGISARNPIFTPTAHWDKIIDLLHDMLSNDDKEYYCLGDLYKIFYYMQQYSENKIDSYVEPSLLYIRNVIGYIKLKYSEPITVEHIAFACGLNRSYLTRLFKDATGYTLQQYLMVYRMKMAMNLLTTTNKSVQDISVSVGYTDLFTFSKAFKRHFGYSPNHYRKAGANPSAN